MSRSPSLAIVGAGQIGTALGAALLRTRPREASWVVVMDSVPERAQRAVQLGAADQAIFKTAQLSDCEVVILAIPVLETLAWITSQGHVLQPGALLLDTGSAKRSVVQVMASDLAPGVDAVGGHPLAGTERQEPAGDGSMLAGARFALVPVSGRERALARASALVSQLGCLPLVIDAAAHDRMLARTSHAPHLVACALAAMCQGAAANGEPLGELVGPGYQSMTRLAASQPEMVSSFLLANADEVQASLRELELHLAQGREALAGGKERLLSWLAAGLEARAAAMPAQ